jgi:hypothetical protein
MADSSGAGSRLPYPQVRDSRVTGIPRRGGSRLGSAAAERGSASEPTCQPVDNYVDSLWITCRESRLLKFRPGHLQAFPHHKRHEAREAGFVTSSSGATGWVWRGNLILPGASDSAPSRRGKRASRTSSKPKCEAAEGPDKQLDALLKTAWSQGAWARKCANGHVMVYHPTNLEEKVLVNNSESNRHLLRTVKKALARAGFKV